MTESNRRSSNSEESTSDVAAPQTPTSFSDPLNPHGPRVILALEDELTTAQLREAAQSKWGAEPSSRLENMAASLQALHFQSHRRKSSTETTMRTEEGSGGSLVAATSSGKARSREHSPASDTANSTAGSCGQPWMYLGAVTADSNAVGSAPSVSSPSVSSTRSRPLVTNASVCSFGSHVPATPSASSSYVPSLAYSGSTIDSQHFSARTSLASAVSGVQPHDPETLGPYFHVPLQRWECPFYYLDCNLGAFDSRDLWETHCLSHFKRAGPPARGSKCPLCDYEAIPTLLPNPLLDLNLREIAARRRRLNLYETDQGYRDQCLALWKLRQDHVAQHFEHGWTSAASEPDIAMIDYLYRREIVSSAAYKELMGFRGGNSNNTDGGAFTANADSRRARYAHLYDLSVQSLTYWKGTMSERRHDIG